MQAQNFFVRGLPLEMTLVCGKCPVCGNGPMTELPTGYSAFVEKDKHKQPIGGLVAFQCEEDGHVFFVPKTLKKSLPSDC